MAGVHFEIDGSNDGLIRKLRESRLAIINSGDVAEQQGARIENSFKRIAAGAATLGVGLSIKELITNITQVRGEFQKFEAVLGNTFNDTGKAKEAMRMISNFAASTPFQVDQLTGSFVKLANMGFVPTLEEMTKMGDLASSTGKGFDQLTEAIIDAQTGENERLKEFGIRASVNGNKVTYTFKEQATTVENTASAIRAYILSLGDLQGVHGANAKISATLTGEISNLSDKFTAMYNEIGQSTEGIISSSIGGVAMIVENYETIGKTILELAAVYGMYKAVLMSVAAYQSMAVGITYAAEITELSKLIPLKQQSANQDIIAAVNSGKLTQAKAEQVIALRAEIAAKIQSLQATEAQTKVEYASAMASYKVATQRMLLAKQNMAIAQSQISIAIKSGTVEEIATAKKNAQTASLELNNAAVAKNTAHKGVNIAATNSKSASEALNTLETGLNTVAQNTNTTSTNILTVAKTKLAAASKALGLSMLANPYVLAAAAVAGLGYGIYKLITYQTDAEKAQAKLNDAVKEYEKSSLSEQRELSKLKGELSGLTKGTDEYNTVKDKIVKGFGKYYSGLDAEIEKVGLTETAYNKLTDAINKSFGARQYEKFASEQQEELSNTMAENLGNIQDKLLEELGNETGSKIYAKIRNSMMQGSLSLGAKPFEIQGLDAETKAALDKVAGEEGGLFDITNRSIEGYVQNIILANKATDKLDKKARERFGIDDNSGKKNEDTITQNEEEKKAASEWLSSYKKSYEDADKAYNDFLKSKQVMSDADRDNELKRLKENRDTAKATYESKGGSTSSDTKQENQSEKLRKDQEKYKLLMDKQKLDQIRSEEDLQMQVDDARIKAMDEGSKKTITQMELNFEKEMQTIDRQKEDALRKKIEDDRKEFEDNPENKKKPFDATGIELSNDEKKKYDALYKSEIEYFEQDKQRMEFQHMQDYLKEYGTFQQKKLAIAKEYDEKIRNSQNEWERKSFAKERDTKISGLETDAIKANIDWVAVFGEFGGMFNDMIKPALEKAKEYVKTDKFKNSDQDSQKSLIDAINQMEKSLGGAEGVNFKKLGQDIKAYQLAEQNRILAIESEADAINKLKKAQEDYEKAIKSGTETEKLSAKDALDNAQQNADAASTNVKAQTEISNQSQQDVTDTATKLKANMDNVTEGLSKLASGGIKNAYDGLIQAGKGMGGAIEAVSDKLEDVPIIGWIVSIIDVFKDGLSDLVGGLLDSIFNAVSGIISDVLSGDLFVTIGKSLASGVGKILNSITFGGFNSWFNVNGNEKETAEKIEKLTNSNEALKTSIDGLTKKMEESNGVKSIDYYQKAKYAQDRSNENYRQILDAQMRYSSAHHSNSYYWDLNKSSLSQVNNLLGTNLKNSWADFSKLTSEQMNDIRTQLPDIWSEMIDEGKYGDRFKDDWNNYADQAGKIEELTEKINENIAQISFDGLRDSFIDSLMDMDASAEDFANKFEEYLMRSMLNFSVGDMIDDDMKTWYNSWAETIGKQNGELTPEQIKQYKKEWDDMVQKGIDKRNDLAELTGYDPSSSSSQDSTQKGFAAMSQDTGNELNGRFTALQISNEEIKNTMLLVLGNLSALSATSVDNNGILSDMRNLAVMSNSYLDDIARHTKVLLLFGEKLDKIESNTKGLSSR